MGEAKRRGTFEQRKAAAIIRNDAAMFERMREMSERSQEDKHQSHVSPDGTIPSACEVA